MCLSGCLAGAIPACWSRGTTPGPRPWRRTSAAPLPPGDFYLEIQNHGIPEELTAAQGLRRLSRETGIPLVLTNDAHYLEKSDARTQDVLLCIQTGKTVDDPGRMRFQGEEFYLKSQEEMAALFPDLPEAMAATEEIAEKCNFDFTFGTYHLPRYPLPEGETDSLSYLKRLCWEGFAPALRGWDEKICRQLAFELDTISGMGFVDYFLIVWDFIAYAKGQGIPVGPAGAAPRVPW